MTVERRGWYTLRARRRVRALLVAALIGSLAASVAACDSTTQPTASQSAPAVAPVSPAPVTLDSPSPTPPPEPGREIYGYVPYWEMDSGIADHLDATPLTTLALFSVTHTGKGAINTGKSGYRQITGDIGHQLIRDAHRRGERVELVYTSFGVARNRKLLERAGLQASVVASLVALADELGVDGINVDIESVDPLLVPAYGAFVGALRTAITSGQPARQVSVATTGNELGAAMALAATEAGADRVFVMAYNYRTGGSSPGATTPIARRDGSSKDLGWTLDLYADLGVPPERTILGLPLYGYTWPVSAPEIASAETGPGAAWVPRRHLDLLTNPEATPLHDTIEAVDVYLIGSDGSFGPPATTSPAAPTAATGPAGVTPGAATAAPSPAAASATPRSGAGVTWQAVYIDSPATLAIKIGYALDRGFAGVGFWAIGYERGLPGYTDLMRHFVAGTPLP